MGLATLVEVRCRLERHAFRSPFAEYLGAFFGSRGKASSLMVDVELSDGRRGSGEATLLPGWSGETLSSASALLDDVLRPALTGLSAERAAEQAWLALGANGYLLWALESAIGKALGAASLASPVPIRGLIGPFDQDTSGRLAADLVEEGYRHLKIKLSGELADDDRRLRAVRDAAPAASLIADGNESIPYEDLSRYRTVFRATSVAGVEQPCPRTVVLERGLPPPDGWLWIADESIWGYADAVELRHGPWHAWTLHPGKSRGEAALRAIVQVAEEHGIAALIGSNLHFGCGVAALYRIASELPSSGESDRLAHDLPAPVVYQDWEGPGLLLVDGALHPSGVAAGAAQVR